MGEDGVCSQSGRIEFGNADRRVRAPLQTSVMPKRSQLLLRNAMGTASIHALAYKFPLLHKMLSTLLTRVSKGQIQERHIARGEEEEEDLEKKVMRGRSLHKSIKARLPRQSLMPVSFGKALKCFVLVIYVATNSPLTCSCSCCVCYHCYRCLSCLEGI